MVAAVAAAVAAAAAAVVAAEAAAAPLQRSPGGWGEAVSLGAVCAAVAAVPWPPSYPSWPCSTPPLTPQPSQKRSHGLENWGSILRISWCS